MSREAIRPSGLLDGQKVAYLQDVERYKSVLRDFETRACPGCNQLGFEDFFCELFDAFTFVRCNGCWTVYMNPGPTEALVRWFYAESRNYQYWADVIYPMTRESRQVLLHQERAAWVVSQIRDHGGGQSEQFVIEVGSGTGDTLRAIRQLAPAIEVLALEPSPAMNASWQEDMPLVSCYIEDFRPRRAAHAVIAFEVVEHLLRPASLFEMARDSLEPGGLLLLSTPNAHSLEIQTLRSESESVDIEHISLLTPLGIHCLARRFGFSVLSLTTPGRLDSEILLNHGDGDSHESSLVADLLGKRNSPDGFQAWIANGGFSSHMRVALAAV